MAKPARAALVPALRPDLALTPDEADLSAAAVDTFTTAMGGRQAVLDALVVASSNPEVARITSLLLDPRYAGWSLRRICTLGGITVADLFAAYRKALFVQAHLRATKLVVEQLPAVVDDIMKRSRPYETDCTACEGLGSITPDPTKDQPNPNPQRCKPCRGTGRLVQAPDLDRQKVALELGQLVSQRGGVQIQQNNVQLPGGGGGSAVMPGALEQLQQAVQSVLYPRAAAPTEAPAAAPVDGEVIDEPPDQATG